MIVRKMAQAQKTTEGENNKETKNKQSGRKSGRTSIDLHLQNHGEVTLMTLGSPSSHKCSRVPRRCAAPGDCVIPPLSHHWQLIHRWLNSKTGRFAKVKWPANCETAPFSNRMGGLNFQPKTSFWWRNAPPYPPHPRSGRDAGTATSVCTSLRRAECSFSLR